MPKKASLTPNPLFVCGYTIASLGESLSKEKSPVKIVKNTQNRLNDLRKWVEEEAFVEKHSAAVRAIEAPLRDAFRKEEDPSKASGFWRDYLSGYHMFAISLLKMPMEELQQRIDTAEGADRGGNPWMDAVLASYHTAYTVRFNRRYKVEKSNFVMDDRVADPNLARHPIAGVWACEDFLPKLDSGLTDDDLSDSIDRKGKGQGANYRPPVHTDMLRKTRQAGKVA